MCDLPDRRTLVVGSAFRNSTGYLTRYFTQVAWLQKAFDPLGFDVRVSAIEGDSVDDTRNALCHVASMFGIDDCTVTVCNHGQRWFGSTEEQDRMAALSKVGNAILDSVRESDDLLFYVESDLLWDARVIADLYRSWVEASNKTNDLFDSVSPMPFAGQAFYDIWGFRGMDGERYLPFTPFHRDLVGCPSQLVEVSSVGSCLLMTASLATDRRARMTNGALVEFCVRAREAGYRFAVNPSLRINHP